jgi:hypothetical protein
MRLFVFADEAGDFHFARSARASKYFIICTIVMDACDVGHRLLDLRRKLLWEKSPLRPDGFHASEDKQAVRDQVFTLIAASSLRIQATIMEKSKAQPQVRETKARFYQYGWLYHLRHGGKKFIRQEREYLITAASIATKRDQAAFTGAVNDVIQQTVPRDSWVTAFARSSSDPCLQIADYCTWAIQRKWESGGEDLRSYKLIASKIEYEYDLWAHGKDHYY